MRDLNQLIIKFNYENNFKDDDFYVSKSNKNIFDLINSWPRWEKNFLNISGEKYSRKTHLSKIFKIKSDALYLHSSEINDQTLRRIKLQRLLR